MKKTFRTVLAKASFVTASLAIAMIPVTASAQQNAIPRQAGEIVSNSKGIVASYDAANLIPILQEMGIQWRGVTMPTGEKVLLAQDNRGIRFSLVPMACQTGASANCKGLNIIAGFNGKAPQTAVNSFNYRYPFVSAGITDDSTLYVSRYEIADYGAFRGNIAANVLNFLSHAANFQQTLSNARRTVSLDSYSSDMAANSLNMEALMTASVGNPDMAKIASANFTPHMMDLEKTTAMISMFAEADKLSPGKIMNSLDVKK